MKRTTPPKMPSAWPCAEVDELCALAVAAPWADELRRTATREPSCSRPPPAAAAAAAAARARRPLVSPPLLRDREAAAA
jgi:hypothetical protein